MLRDVVIEVDVTYSKCFPTRNGNVRGFHNWILRGESRNDVVAPFRRETRGEIVIRWGLFSSEQMIFIIGKF